jgi:FixJ family two-component response regulator
LLDAIELGLERARRARAPRAENQELNGGYLSLTLREREVMAYAVADLLNKQAAGSCGHELNDREKHRTR